MSLHRRHPVPLLLAIAVAAVVPALPASAAEPPVDVCSYLENPQMVAEGQVGHHAELRPYADTAAALRAGREPDTKWTRSLDGKWRIRMADRPQDVPSGFQAEGYDTSQWREVTVPHTWQPTASTTRSSATSPPRCGRTTHVTSQPFGFREIEIRDRQLLVNGERVLIKGTNRAETDPETGRPEWQIAFMDRFVGMVERDKNHPSVFMWDTGNEAGLGKAHYAMAEWATATDPSRPLYHQSNGPDGDAPFAHVWGPRYPSPSGVEAMAKPLKLDAGATTTVQLPTLPPDPSGVERWLDVEAVLAKPTAWAPAGHVVSHGQFAVGGNQVRGITSPETGGNVGVEQSGDDTLVSGRDFRYAFDKNSGTLTSMKVRGKELLTGGPELDAWRAPIYNGRH
ncbi:glycoside hydrolase family 2 TIM barrel-domain containing protein [Saccharothrix deserti]|uniref:glycoside hydrolase family 2 TIM barrel-domain containing protein n=1 Tax=Saccharothrix deserti TaxID=2593674 RepID=UPI001EE466E6|nr:glycoside hydrolase family 2 TIM barrel-domain containing protein [Saccharothrix deserti]